VTTKTFEVQVYDHHLARLAQTRKPILAVAELIWNAVDADADEVTVALSDGARRAQSGVSRTCRRRDGQIRA